MEDVAAPPQAAHRFPHLVKTQRTLQIILGLFWILDAGLQFQPFMFSKAFVSDNILANASGQPAVIGWVITNVGHFLEPHITVWNTLFALIQVVIGAGLLFRRTVRPALAISFAWALGVWVFGEGLGMVLTGTATALTGAPGSVLIYGLIGLMAWPRSPSVRSDWSGEEEATWTASSAAGRGLGGPVTPLVVWSGFWVLAAILFLLPDNRTRTSVSSAIVGMAPGTPGWFSHFLTSFGNYFNSSGPLDAWLLAVASLVIALGTLLSRRPGIFLFAGGLLAAVMWITAQGFVGDIFTGSGTDPNTGPLIVLLALAMVPATLPERSTWRSPLASLLRWNPVLAAGGVVTLGVALFLSAAYPVSAEESTNMAMSGMNGTAAMSSSGSDTASSATCTGGNNGTTRSGLDLTNTPYMIMGGHDLGMNLNGADANAAAGFNATKSDWHYTGPALPSATADELLADGNNGPDDIHMAETGCAAEPTFSQQIYATQFVQSTSQAVARYANPFEAAAAGYVAVSPSSYPVVYYVNPTIQAANAAAKRTLDPQYVDGLVFAKTPTGAEVLAAAMYLLPTTVRTAPMPYGALVQWHQRTDVCAPLSGSPTTALGITGTPPCNAQSVQKPTPYMTLVWQVPVAGGPLAIQPPDIQIVEAAVMQATSP